MNRSARPPVAGLPVSPGVYRFRDSGGRVLYIGRATSLRSRVSSYWGDLGDRRHLARMVRAVTRIEAVACDSMHEAAWLERNLLEERMPRFNRTPGGQESPSWLLLDASSRSPGLRLIHTPPPELLPPAAIIGPQPTSTTAAVRHAAETDQSLAESGPPPAEAAYHRTEAGQTSAEAEPSLAESSRRPAAARPSSAKAGPPLAESSHHPAAARPSLAESGHGPGAAGPPLADNGYPAASRLPLAESGPGPSAAAHRLAKTDDAHAVAGWPSAEALIRSGGGRLLFGPYLGGNRARLALSALHRLHPLAYAGENLTGAEREMAAKRAVHPADRLALAAALVAILGRDPTAVAAARERLELARDQASAELAFERAGTIQAEIAALEWTTAPQRATTAEPHNAIVHGWADGLLTTFTIRGGRLCEWTQRRCSATTAKPRLAETPPQWRPFAQRNALLAAALHH